MCAILSNPTSGKPCRRAGSPGHGLARQSDRQVRDRRSRRRLRPDRAQRSLSIPTAERRRMAAARSRARIRPKSIARPPMPRAISRKTSSPPDLPIAARSSFPMRSALPNPCRSMSIRMAQGKFAEEKLEATLGQAMRLSPRGIREHLYAQSADLRAHRRLWSFRTFARTPKEAFPGKRPIWRRSSKPIWASRVALARDAGK